MAHHTRDVDESARRIAKSRAVGIDEIENAPRTTNRLVLPPIIGDIKSAERWHGAESLGGHTIEEVSMLAKKVINGTGLRDTQWRAALRGWTPTNTGKPRE